MQDGPSPTYETWNEVIYNRFLGSPHRHQHVYLQVDDDTLCEMAESLGIAADRAESLFINAVRSQLRRDLPDLFHWFDVQSRLWKRSAKYASTPPLFLGLLGLTVLAASLMQRDEKAGIAPHNYYTRLNDLLDIPDRGMPLRFQRVTEFWRELADWLDECNQGNFGWSTAAPLSNLTNIGYPISQCLLRAVDRQHLPEFFILLQISPGEDVDVADLLEPFSRWCEQPNCPLSSMAKALILGNDAARHLATQIVAREASNWNGDTYDGESYRSAPIALWIQSHRGGYSFELQFFPRRPQGFPSGPFQLNSSGNRELVPLDDENSEWYQSISLDPATVLNAGVHLRRGRYQLIWDPKPIVVARDDPYVLGGFVSQPRTTLRERHVVLCRSYLSSPLEQLLLECATREWRRAPGSKGLPSGWIAYVDVSLEKQPSLSSITPDLRCLVPETRISVKLEGGLKLGGSAWLAQAEPIVRAVLSEPDVIRVTVDSQHSFSFHGISADVDLSSLNLPSGQHSVVVNGRARNFVTCRADEYRAAFSSQNVTGHLAHVLVREGDHYAVVYPSPERVLDEAPQPGEIWVIGPVIRAREEDSPEQLPEPLAILSGGRRYILLGPNPGMVWECTDPLRTSFRIRSMGDQTSLAPFEVVPPFHPVWLVRVSHARHTTVRRIGAPVHPKRESWSGGHVEDWSRWLRKKPSRGPNPEDADLWQEYGQMARSL